MKRWGFIAFFGLLLLPTAAVFAMTSTNYGIHWDSVNSGGTDDGTSESYKLRDTVGELGTGIGTSENYQLSAGYRVGDGDESALSLFVGTQENQTRTVWTAFSNGSKTVDVAAVNNFSTGTYIGVVENSGASQLVAFGKITNISGLTITVDAWEGEPGSISSTPAGGNDYVYRMNGSAASLGTQSVNSIATSFTLTDVVSSVENGYTVSVQSDTDFRSATGTFIVNVADGAVSAGSEEYGGEAVGSHATSTGMDFAFSSSTTRNIQQSAAVGNHDRSSVLYKLSITARTPSGNFGQTVYYRLTPNY